MPSCSSWKAWSPGSIVVGQLRVRSSAFWQPAMSSSAKARGLRPKRHSHSPTPSATPAPAPCGSRKWLSAPPPLAFSGCGKLNAPPSNRRSGCGAAPSCGGLQGRAAALRRRPATCSKGSKSSNTSFGQGTELAVYCMESASLGRASTSSRSARVRRQPQSECLRSRDSSAVFTAFTAKGASSSSRTPVRSGSPGLPAEATATPAAFEA
mmetsp:Transcript_105944/g.331382  ORF Transcript_105944/g.331382 Transcript_105944/m.331382 type:complete len:209 (-) Transcript_105944:103-729(-)